MKGTRLPESWEKQTWWLLENGVKVCEEWNQCYGPFVKRMELGEESWNASSGLPPKGLFSFAEEWREEGDSNSSRLIRPNFEKNY